MKTTKDIITLVNTGANLIVDASSNTTMDLRQIINAVIKKGSHITLKNCDRKTIMDLRGFCINHPELITMDLS